MLSWLFNSDNYDYYKLWQDKQPSTHFVSSSLQSYIYPKPGYKDPYLRYVFGDFENLIYLPDNCDVFGYFNLLISTYDKCKGYVRTIKGDCVGVTLLRKVTHDKNTDSLYEFDFTIYNYPYNILHAHTIAYFSLSTLILFLVSNYMYYHSYKSDRFVHIDHDVCKKMYFEKIYGDISYVAANKNIKSLSIPIKQIKDQVKVCSSWPSSLVVTNKCQNCNRVCDQLWVGKFCINCHLYEVCHVCGGLPFSKSKTGYPVCVLHQND